jgi:hypothetical protein
VGFMAGIGGRHVPGGAYVVDEVCTVISIFG